MSTKPHDTASAKAVEKQMRNWEINRQQHTRDVPKAGVHDFITITNNVGGGGREVAVALAEQLGWPMFDRQILTEMAGDDETRVHLYRSLDERDIGWLEGALRCLMEEEFRKNDYFHRLTETLYCLARQSHAIFVGRAADLILPKTQGLRVKVVASLNYRVGAFAKNTGLSLDQARTEVARIEAERHDFIWNHFHMDVNEQSRFDLLINVERFTPRQAVDLIMAAMQVRDTKT